MTALQIEMKAAPVLDPGFVPAVLWDAAYRDLCRRTGSRDEAVMALTRPDGTVFLDRIPVLPYDGQRAELVFRAVERTIKFLLWQKGASTIRMTGPAGLVKALGQHYGPGGARAFDAEILGGKVFLQPLQFSHCAERDLPEARTQSVDLGRHLDGCRIGFDLGGSDRKCAAVIDGEVVFSEEVAWDPYFQHDPAYHYKGIKASLERAAAHLPRVDAIGGSAAGIYVNNEPRVASLFRGVAERDFNETVRPIFHRLQAEWNGVPFEVVNDGEVTALAGSMALKDNAVLGVSMGTSQAAGYCTPDGGITPWLNELAFAPVDYRENAPVDEWSGDSGCGVQYFSQQAVARLMPAAGLDTDVSAPLPEKLEQVQERMAAGDARAQKIYATIGAYLGYTIAWYARFYDIRHLLLLGRVTSGDGGTTIVNGATSVLAAEFPELADRLRMSMPDEKTKRHGQAVAAASLPALSKPAPVRRRECTP